MRPLIISHAACAGHAPENTLAGIQAALKLGVDGIEIDIQSTSDDIPILMHDLTVDRTTNGSGDVSTLSFDKMKALDAGGEPVPSLAEVLDLTRGRALLVIEVKRPGIEESICRVVREANALDDAMIWSFFPQVLETMRAVEPRLPSALLISAMSFNEWPKLRVLAVRLGLQGVSVFHLGANDQTATDARRMGLALYTWTPDDPDEMTRLLGVGVDGICTNYPDRALAAVHDRSRAI